MQLTAKKRISSIGILNPTRETRIWRNICKRGILIKIKANGGFKTNINQEIAHFWKHSCSWPKQFNGFNGEHYQKMENILKHAVNWRDSARLAVDTCSPRATANRHTKLLTQNCSRSVNQFSRTQSNFSPWGWKRGSRQKIAPSSIKSRMNRGKRHFLMKDKYATISTFAMRLGRFEIKIPNA